MEIEENFSPLYSAFEAGLYSFQALIPYFPLGRGCQAGRPGMAAGMSKWVLQSFGGRGFHTASSSAVRTPGVIVIGELPCENSRLENP